ncbi:MAG: Asp-tRNA(Asn)/Glu-tRNA(Gln) amidotransferase subunit GatB, partial [Acidobacteria bacterium]|nr:Asp-tRNA(Asn)/Glu-tRNA(Gln) amidotransferase subunit GatB [Acidobacteriota bacterium]
LFCRCPNRFGAPPNSLVCPICLGYPGTLPLLNREAVDRAVRLAAALGCEVRDVSVFARKNYFYADLPKGYQISQYDRPLAEGGTVPLSQHSRSVRLHRLHLEEDAGKLLHEAPGGAPLGDHSLVDFNRCGVPLVEIVSEPDLASPSEAEDFLRTLHRVLRYTGTSDGNMEEGSLRCDANVSLRRPGAATLGTKTEVKNLNSFRNVARALEAEIERQAERLDAGEAVIQETRGFDADRGTTWPLRGKEEAHDYRYFPEPDLRPLTLAPERVARLRSDLPELPWERRSRFVASLGLPAEDAADLTAARELADYFERVVAVAAEVATPRTVGNWVRNEVLRELKVRRAEIGAAPDPALLAELLALVERGELSAAAARTVLSETWSGAESPRAAMERLGLVQVRDESQLGDWVDQVLAAHAESVAEWRAGNVKVFGFLIGQVMKRSAGRADPKRVRELLTARLDETAPTQ